MKTRKTIEEVKAATYKNMLPDYVNHIASQYKSASALEKRLVRESEKETAIIEASPISRAEIEINWKRSSWGSMCPRGVMKVWFKDGTFKRFEEYAGGYGYDKLSSVVSYLLNDCAKGMAAAALRLNPDSPYGIGKSAMDWHNYPYYEYGVGISCYTRKGGVFDFIGLDCRHTEGKTWDHIELTSRD